MIQDSFEIVVFLQIFGAMFSLGINLYYLSQHGTNIPNFYLFVSYFFGVTFVLLFFNWFGNELTVSVSLLVQQSIEYNE